jgi:RNA polymerase sigma factor for flagellar operon FliA
MSMMEAVDPEIWARYKEVGDPALRELIARHYQPLVNYVARMVAGNIPGHVDRDDLVSWGNLGLLDAIERYEPERGIKFQTYSMTRIRGAIVDGLRAVDWVPRSVRARAREIDGAFLRLEAELGRPPNRGELARALEISEQEVSDIARDVSAANFHPLDEEVSVGRKGDRLPLAELIDDQRAESPETAAVIAEAKVLFAHAIGKLAENLRIVVTLHHYDGCSFGVVAEALNVTESRVCQLYAQAMLALARTPI